MEATAADISHIAELDASVTVNWCWFPEVFVISGNEEPKNKRESVPQSISMVKQAHLPGDKSLVTRKVPSSTWVRD